MYNASYNTYFRVHCQWRCCLFLLFIFITVQIAAQEKLQPIGQWREHLPYQSVVQVVAAPNKVFTATPYNVFSVDDEGTINRLSKVTGLNDVGVSAISWDDATRQLVIGYTNSNVDVVKDRTVRNISDIERSNIAGNKTVYYIYCNNGKAFLCTGIGIIVLDLTRYDVADTWRIGSNGSQVKVTGFTTDANFWYAATAEGLKRAQRNAANLSDYRNWQLITGSNGLTSGAVVSVMAIDTQIVVQKNDSVFISNGNSWHLLYADLNWPIVSINSAEGKILVCQRTITGDSRVLIVNATGNIEKIVAQPGVISFPKWATIKGSAIWITDFFGGLAKFSGSVERYIPTGPLGTATGEMVVNNHKLYVAAGSVNDAWNYQYNRNGLYVFSGDEWTNINRTNTPALDSTLDLVTIAVDPADESVWAGSFGGGLVNIATTGSTKIFKQNSTLQPAIGDPTSYRVSGLAFDQQGNLWISNYGAGQNLHVRKRDGSFKAFSIPFFHSENAVSQIVVDDVNQLWIASPKGNSVFVYNPGPNIDVTNDDRWKFFRLGAGAGNLPSNEVFSIAKDKNGFIWIGTARGVGVVQCAEQVFDAQGCEAILPVVQQDRFAGYLLQDEEVRTIAVDGANRKWVGTKNGVWLLSAEGDKVIYRFTEDNSPLLSNDVKRIAIDPSNGEVFISTFKGICSFRSTATDGKDNNADVLVFPNPVPPNYAGTIAIRGVANNSIVKIAEMNGRLVFETRALGGQAVWNGRNYKGEKVASGVYLVLVKDEGSTERLVTKIVMVGR
jgi:hypothetical protein